MALVKISCDTETHEISVNIDGETFDNVESVIISNYENYEDEMKTQISVTMIPEKVSHLTKRVYVSSANIKEAQTAIADKKATSVSKDGKIVKYQVESDLKAAVAKMLKR